MKIQEKRCKKQNLSKFCFFSAPGEVEETSKIENTQSENKEIQKIEN